MVTRILRMGLALKLWFAVPYLFLRLPISICEVFTLKRERHLFTNSELDDLVVIFYHRINLDAISFKAHPWPWGLQGARRGKVWEPFVANSGAQVTSSLLLPYNWSQAFLPVSGISQGTRNLENPVSISSYLGPSLVLVHLHFFKRKTEITDKIAVFSSFSKSAGEGPR